MKPTPKVVSTICTVCDEPWEDHGDKPTIEDCIRLLKRHRGVVIQPTPFTPNYPWGWPQWPKVWYTINQAGNTTAIESQSYEVTNAL